MATPKTTKAKTTKAKTTKAKMMTGEEYQTFLEAIKALRYAASDGKQAETDLGDRIPLEIQDLKELVRLGKLAETKLQNARDALQ